MLTLITHGHLLDEESLEWIDRELILPAVPPVRSFGRAARAEAAPSETADSPLIFASDQLHRIGALVGAGWVRELGLRVRALTVQPWYLHVVCLAVEYSIDQLRRHSEGVIQKALNWRRPVWSEHYAKRYLFEVTEVERWAAYVEWHNLASGWDARPWPFLQAASAGGSSSLEFTDPK